MSGIWSATEYTFFDGRFLLTVKNTKGNLWEWDGFDGAETWGDETHGTKPGTKDEMMNAAGEWMIAKRGTAAHDVHDESEV